jgi:hypothetical protein
MSISGSCQTRRGPVVSAQSSSFAVRPLLTFGGSPTSCRSLHAAPPLAAIAVAGVLSIS